MDRPFAAYKGDEPYIFVSYAHEDAALVYKELAWLRDLGYNIWYDEGISPGGTWRQELAHALKQCQLFLLFVTPASAGSDNCLKEVNYALDEGCPLLAVHLKPTHLSEGLKLSLSDRQAILKYELKANDYAGKIIDGIDALASLEATSPPYTVPTRPRWPVYGAALGILLVVVAVMVWFYQPAGPAVQPRNEITGPPAPPVESPASDETAIAVLPFVNMSDDREQEFFSDGLSEDLMNGLSNSANIKVIARTSAFAFKNSNQDVREIGKTLGVSHVLEGSVRKAGNRIRVSAQLVSTVDGAHLWSHSYDRELVDVFAVQDEITSSILGALDIHFRAPDDGVRVPTSNTEAYNAYLLGRQRISLLQFDQAIDALETANSLDPEYAEPLSAIAYVYTLKVWFLASRMTEALPHIQEFTKRALALDPTDQRARRINALNTFFVDQNYQLAIDELHQLLTENSNGLDQVSAYGVILQALGKYDLAINVWAHGLKVDPLSPRAHYQMGDAYNMAGHFDRARASYQTAELMGLPCTSELGFIAVLTGDDRLIDEIMARPESAWGSRIQFRPIIELLVANYRGQEDKLRGLIADLRASSAFEQPAIKWQVLNLEHNHEGVLAHMQNMIDQHEYLPMRSMRGDGMSRRLFPELFNLPEHEALLKSAGLDDASVARLNIPTLPF